MRNTPGNIIQFPESTLLIDIQCVKVFTERNDDYNFSGSTEVELEDGYIYHLTNGSVLVPVMEVPSVNAHGYVKVAIHLREDSVYRYIAMVGDDLLYPAYAARYAKSQPLDLWVWGDVLFEVEVAMEYDGCLLPRYDLFLVKYRR
jgi:hypothetical protein